MQRRVVFAVSALLFTLLAVAVGIVTDLHDRSYPQGLGATESVSLDFSASGISDRDAFGQLGSVSDRLGLGLMKVAPDLTGDQSGQVFVVVGSGDGFPDRIRRFGDQPDALVRSSAALEHSYASGEYLITGQAARGGDFRTWLAERRVLGTWVDDSLSTTLSFVVRQRGFAMSLLAAAALMVSLVLYWLSVKAKGRALRVLAGVSTVRIQSEDLLGFLAVVSSAALVCGVASAFLVGVGSGWIFAPYYVSTLVLFDVIVIAVTVTCASVMSAVSWPSVRTFAERAPAVTGLRKASIALKAVTFFVVLAAVPPAVDTYADSREASAQQSQWKSLADQVAISFPAAMGEKGFEAVMGGVAETVKEAERRDAVALSYAWTSDNAQDIDLGGFAAVSLVNERWLRLMLGHGGDAQSRGLAQIAAGEVPSGVGGFLDANLQLWLRDHQSVDAVRSRLSFYRYSASSKLPLSLGGNGDLVFPERSLLVVTPDLYATFNDDFLASVASTKNLVFTGLGQTLALLAQQGLQTQLQVKYVAEEGVLRAQIANYLAWLQGFSLVVLIVALALSALVAAFITASLGARSDFPRRLAGGRWPEIVVGRVGRESAVGVLLALVVAVPAGARGALVVAGAALLALLISPVTHIIAARWVFGRVSLRRL